MKAEQGDRCLICGNKPHLLVVDHDHKCCPQRHKTCGKCVRGLLCRSCNTLIGLAKESEEVLSKAIEYLQSYRKANHGS